VRWVDQLVLVVVLLVMLLVREVQWCTLLVGISGINQKNSIVPSMTRHFDAENDVRAWYPALIQLGIHSYV